MINNINHQVDFLIPDAYKSSNSFNVDCISIKMLKIHEKNYIIKLKGRYTNIQLQLEILISSPQVLNFSAMDKLTRQKISKDEENWKSLF